jgi:hypothetical protein
VKSTSTMTAKYWVATIAALAVIGTAAAGAQSFKIRQRMASEAADLVKDVDYTNSVCGTALAVKFDWASAPAEDLLKYSPEGYCNAALEGIQRVCGDTVGKDAVRQKIKSVTCGFSASRAIVLKDGTVDYKINFNSVNDADFVFEYLQNNL